MLSIKYIIIYNTYNIFRNYLLHIDKKIFNKSYPFFLFKHLYLLYTYIYIYISNDRFNPNRIYKFKKKNKRK